MEGLELMGTQGKIAKFYKIPNIEMGHSRPENLKKSRQKTREIK